MLSPRYAVQTPPPGLTLEQELARVLWLEPMPLLLSAESTCRSRTQKAKILNKQKMMNENDKVRNGLTNTTEGGAFYAAFDNSENGGNGGNGENEEYDDNDTETEISPSSSPSPSPCPFSSNSRRPERERGVEEGKGKGKGNEAHVFVSKVTGTVTDTNTDTNNERPCPEPTIVAAGETSDEKLMGGNNREVSTDDAQLHAQEDARAAEALEALMELRLALARIVLMHVRMYLYSHVYTNVYMYIMTSLPLAPFSLHLNDCTPALPYLHLPCYSD